MARSRSRSPSLARRDLLVGTTAGLLGATLPGCASTKKGAPAAPASPPGPTPGGAGAPGPTPRPLPPRIVRFDAPAGTFEQAFPLGNGRIGATVHGEPNRERLMLNEETLWAGGPVDPYMNRDAHRHVAGVRKLLLAERYEEADKAVRTIQGSFSTSYAPLGDLVLAFAESGPATEYGRELDLRRAIATVRYRVGDTVYRREAFVSFPDQVLCIRLSTEGPEQLDVSVTADSKHPHQTTARAGVLELAGRAPVYAAPNYLGEFEGALRYEDDGGMRFGTSVRVLETDGQVHQAQGRVRVQGATFATLVVAVATSYAGFDKDPGKDGADERARLQSAHDGVQGLTFEQLRTRHVTDYQALFDRVCLELGPRTKPEDIRPTDQRLREYTDGREDPDLEALYFQFGRYLLISSSRPGGVPANLQGIWNGHLRPPWSCNYTANINLEMNYWPAETTNLAETHEPLLAFISRLAKTGAVTAKTFYGAKGWCCSHNTDLWAMTNPVGNFGKGHPVWANWSMAGPWLCLHLWEHFAFGGDEVWLRDYAYPLMRGASEFCLDMLVEGPKGTLVTAPSTSPENLYVTTEGYRGAVSYGSTADHALIRALFARMLEAEAILKPAQPLGDALRAALERLHPYQVGPQGELQEWYHPWKGADPEHRHVSHLIGLSPGSELSVQRTPKLTAAVRRSLELRGDGGTGWSKGWKINLWARLRDGDHAHAMLRSHLRYVEPSNETQYDRGGTFPNLLDSHPPFQIDGNFGGTAGMAEMLLQSHGGELHLLPALPAAWSQGEVRGLRARGGVTVDQRWSGGRLVEASLLADRSQSVRLRYDNTVTDVQLQPGVDHRVGPDLSTGPA